MSKKNLELSRRKLLAGVGTAGVAAAGAGLGTTAYLSDTESFDDNVLTAGTLDLLVDYYTYWDQDTAGEESRVGTADGEAVTATLSDVKPGDNGLLAFCPRIETNPAYLWLCGELTANDENSVTEPEAGDDPNNTEQTDADIDGRGELAQNVNVAVKYCELADEIGDSFDEGDVDEIADVWTGTLAEFLDNAQYGLPLDGGVEEQAEGQVGFREPGEQSCFAGTDDGDDNYCLCLDWVVPTSVGNEIQSDSLEFDLEFYAQQCRHNDGTTNPCCSGTSLDRSTGTGDWEVSEFAGDELAEPESPVAVTNPHDAWVDAPQGVSWINPSDGDTTDSDPAGEYEYQTTFELPEDAGDCELVIDQYSADNPVEFFLDGDSLGGYPDDDAYEELRGPIQESVSSSGHTLSARVTNADDSGANPTGLLAVVSVDCDCRPPTTPDEPV